MRPEFIQASDLLRQDTPEAFSEAIGLLQNAVYSFSLKMCGHREDAEDTAQDVLFRSLKHLPKLKEPAGLAAWLYTVTRNRCHRLRGNVHESRSFKSSLQELMPEEAELKMLLLDSAASPEDSVLTAERHDLLHQAVLHIPSRLRIVLVLHDMEELSTEEVARILNLQEGSVRVRLHRARLFLRKEMFLALRPALSGRSSEMGKKSEIKDRSARKPKDCRELFASLSEYLDGRVNSNTARMIEAHVEHCPACVVFLRDLRAAIKRCQSLEVKCEPAVTLRLRALMTTEYLRAIKSPSLKTT